MGALYASIMVAMWNDNSSKWHLWTDLIPQGFGMASVITTTLIVGISPSLHGLSYSLLLGSHCMCFQSGRSSGDGQ
jgi:hypothetical protein